MINGKRQKGKPIQLRPSKELRKWLEEEARKQQRSLNNLILLLLAKNFRSTETDVVVAENAE